MKKILLIKRGAMGDVLMATPLIRQLKLVLNCQLDILIGKISSVMITDNPYLDQKYILDDKKLKLGGAISLALQLLKMRGKYDYVFVLDKHWYFNLMAQLLGAKTIGFARDKFSAILLTSSIQYQDVNRYQSLYYLDLLQKSELAAPNYNDIKLDLIINEQTQANALQVLQNNGIKNYIVVVNSGGNNGYEKTGIRMLPLPKIIQLLQILLSRKNWAVILLGGTNDVENYKHYQQILDNPPQLFNFAGKLSITESAYLISQSAKFYTTDCGAMHMGVAMDIKSRMYAFFGPTNPRHFLPEEYIQYDTAVWLDEQIYDPEYQMRGVKNTIKYFEKLDMDSCLCRHDI